MVPVHPSQVTRWFSGRKRPSQDQIQSMERVLGCGLDGMFPSPAPAYELYLSSPITSIPPSKLRSHRAEVEMIAEAVREIVPNLYWPGDVIHSAKDLLAPNRATKRNFERLEDCRGLPYVQMDDTVGPSNCLVELGLALGRRMRTTVILKRDVNRPLMFQGLEAVAQGFKWLPNVQIHEVDSAEDACHLVRANGRSLLGLS